MVWELLNEIDGDTEYLDAHFRPVTSSEQQTSIFTQQQEQEQAERQTLQEARALSLAKCVSPIHAKQEVSAGADAQAAEHAVPSGESVSESVGRNVDNVTDPDYLLALKIQQEEEELARGSGHVSSPHLSNAVERDPAGNSHNEGNVKRNGSGGQDDDYGHDTSTTGLADDVVAANGQLLLSEAQRRAEQYYEEHKRQVDAQTRQCEQEQERLRQRHSQQQQQRPARSSQRRRISESSDCTVS